MIGIVNEVNDKKCINYYGMYWKHFNPFRILSSNTHTNTLDEYRILALLHENPDHRMMAYNKDIYDLKIANLQLCIDSNLFEFVNTMSSRIFCSLVLTAGISREYSIEYREATKKKPNKTKCSLKRFKFSSAHLYIDFYICFQCSCCVVLMRSYLYHFFLFFSFLI